MTPEEKAKELIEHFAETIRPVVYGNLLERDWEKAKACAIILCDEILSIYEHMDEFIIKRIEEYRPIEEYDFWQQVKAIINTENK